METIVISSFPGCGKTQCMEKYKDKFKMLNTNVHLFRYLINVKANETGENPDFPNNYINYIKSNMGNFDFIFVSTDKVVRDELTENNIPIVCIFPSIRLKKDWMERFEKRNENFIFIQIMNNHWIQFIADIESKEYWRKIKFLSDDSYIDLRILECLKRDVDSYVDYKENMQEILKAAIGTENAVASPQNNTSGSEEGVEMSNTNNVNESVNDMMGESPHQMAKKGYFKN